MRIERFAAVILAAGRSRRFGARNKLLARHRGRPLLRAAVDAAAASSASPVIVVTGHQAPAVRGALRGCRLHCVFNRRHASGMASSLRRGLAAVPASRAGAVIVLADMPGLRARDIDRLIEAWQPGDDAVVPKAGDRRGNPALLARSLFARLATLTGDEGARRLLAAGARVRHIEAGADQLRDVDTPRDWRRMRRSALRCRTCS